jgi:hypothetical protein
MSDLYWGIHYLYTDDLESYLRQYLVSHINFYISRKFAYIDNSVAKIIELP